MGSREWHKEFSGWHSTSGMVESYSWLRKKERSGQGSLDKGGRPPFTSMDRRDPEEVR